MNHKALCVAFFIGFLLVIFGPPAVSIYFDWPWWAGFICFLPFFICVVTELVDLLKWPWQIAKHLSRYSPRR